ncbi:MAG: hypothetical protein V8Q79_08935 [Christensenellales bacterium]
MDTTPIYATQAGTVSAVFAGVGDDASGVAAHYGSLAVIEPKNALYIAASTQQAYDDADNRYIHAGETLYLKRNSDKGTGIVTSVSGSGYIVEILTGDYDVNDTIRCFRESSMPSDSEVGRGKVTRYDDVLVNALPGASPPCMSRRATKSKSATCSLKSSTRRAHAAHPSRLLPRGRRRQHAGSHVRRTGLPRTAALRGCRPRHAGAERRAG